MGSFLEDLRRQKATEEGAQKIDQAKAEKERLANLELARKPRVQEKQQKLIRENSWRISKSHFEQTGVRGMLDSIVRIKAAMSISEDKDNKNHYGHFDSGKWYEYDDQPPKEEFTIWLAIGETASESSSIRIVTSADGTLTFHGANGISVPKAEWERSKEILEEALGKAYRKPHIYHSQVSSNRSYEDFMNGSSRG